MVRISGPGKAVRIFIGESDKWGNKPLYQAIVETLRSAGIAGATVTRGLEGFGAHSRLHTTRILRLSEDLPIVIDVVDKSERIDQVLPRLEEIVGEGLITIEDVTVVKYSPGNGDEKGAGSDA